MTTQRTSHNRRELMFSTRKIRAGQVLDEKKNSIRYQVDADALLLEFVLPIFATFAEAACDLGVQGTYSGERVESECYKFLRHLAMKAQLTSRGEIRDDVHGKIDRSDEWKKYRQLLRRVVDAQAANESTILSDPAGGSDGGKYDDAPAPDAPRAHADPNLSDQPKETGRGTTGDAHRATSTNGQEERLQAFIVAHPGTTLADIKYSSDVHTPDFQNWRKGKLGPNSVMSIRIEKVLSGASPLKKKPRKPRAD
jgi:hypothetical protein